MTDTNELDKGRVLEKDREYMSQRLASMTKTDVVGWLRDQGTETYVIALKKTGQERENWLEITAFFPAAVALIDEDVEESE